MSLAGSALLALWNDVAPGHEAAYDRWHTVEHVPERVAVPGMNGARRYVAPARAMHRYFTLYEADDLRVFDSPAYRDLVDHPTPASAAMRPHFRHTLRATARVLASVGAGLGGAIAVLAHDSTLETGALVERALARPGVTACHHAAGSVAPLAWTGATGSSPASRAFTRITLLEAVDVDCAAHALQALAPVLALAADDFGCAVYALAFAYPGHDPGDVARHRRASTTTT